MSDQSDEINTIMRELSEELHKRSEHLPDDEKHEVASEIMTERVPSAEAATHHYMSEASRRIQILFRQWLGGAKFENGEDALGKTKPSAKRLAVEYFLRVFSDGVQLGQGSNHAVRKYRWFNKEDELYEYEGFRQESELLAFRFSSDYDTLELFERHFDTACLMVSESSGYVNYTQADANQKIWDVWMLVYMGSISHVFMAGVGLGSKWKEADVLAGILSATEEAATPNDGRP